MTITDAWNLCPRARGWAAMFWLASSAVGHTEDFRLESVGTRFGLFHDGANAHFYQAEAFANCDLPWSWSLGADWRLQSRMDGSLGWLGQSGVNAAIATCGPSLIAARKTFPISFELGVSPTILSRHDFPSKDLGQLFQFTSHAGINFDVWRRFRLGYRFEHMSNGGFSQPNPGLNLNLFSVSYLF
jgi:hypothetical protein